MNSLSPQLQESFNSALHKLTGQTRRALAAEICIKYFDSSPTKMERHLQVGRAMVQLGLHEHRTGITCVDAYTLRGAKKKKKITPN